MKIFIIVTGCIYCLRVIVNSIFLACNNYPRKVEWTPAQDVGALLISVAFVIWASYLLFF